MTDRVGQHFGNYELVQLLGQGGCAEVYLGKHCYLNSYAALKVLYTRLRSGDEQKFLAEAQTLVNLRHPNIIHLLDFGIENGTPVLIMDYAPNGSLRQACPIGTQIPLTTVVDFVTQIADALQYAHNHTTFITSRTSRGYSAPADSADINQSARRSSASTDRGIGPTAPESYAVVAQGTRFLDYGLLLGFVFGLMIAPPLGLITGLSVGLPLGLFFGSFYSFMGGLASGLQDERNLTRPNQGIWRSARNSVYAGLISALASGFLAGTVFGLLLWLVAGPAIGLTTGLTTGITTLLSVGTIVGLRGGGIACIQHVLLRWHLWRAGSIPWNYPHFLDHAAERILLRKVGGGYIFVHRLLLEYFASLEEKEV